MSKIIGSYALGPPLGTGTFSKVRIGTHKDNGTKYAIKIMDKEIVKEEHAEEQIKRELSLIKNLQHPNVVQMFEVLQTNTHMYLVLELVTGGDLQKTMDKNQKVDETSARKYFQQLILGIQYCHRKQIAHRDLKPENLLLDSDGCVKISDFGLANEQQGKEGKEGGLSGAMMQTVCGTPNYVAPEVIREEGYDGMIADVWSCGVILFYLVAGHLPFDDINLSTLFTKIERGDFVIPRSFSGGLKHLVSAILTVDPKKRAKISDIVKDPWFSVDFDIKLLNVGDVPAASAPPTSSGDPSAIKNATDDHTPLDGMQLIYRLMSTNFGDLITQSSGKMTHDLRRRHVLFRGSLEESRQRLMSALEQHRCNPKNPVQSEIKGFCNQTKGLLTYTIQLLPTVTQRLTLISFKVGRGDENEFEVLFKLLCTTMGDSLASKRIYDTTN